MQESRAPADPGWHRASCIMHHAKVAHILHARCECEQLELSGFWRCCVFINAWTGCRSKSESKENKQLPSLTCTNDSSIGLLLPQIHASICLCTPMAHRLHPSELSVMTTAHRLPDKRLLGRDCAKHPLRLQVLPRYLRCSRCARGLPRRQAQPARRWERK